MDDSMDDNSSDSSFITDEDDSDFWKFRNKYLCDHCNHSNHEQYYRTLFLRNTSNSDFRARVSGSHPGTLISRFFRAAYWANTF